MSSTSSPVPSRRLNNLNGRSRSPSPAANSLINPQPHLSTAQARNNFLRPEDSSLMRARRSVPIDSAIKEDTRAPESIPLIDAEKFNPPLANPETDEIDDDRQTATAPYPGVDDGFFITDRSNPDGQTVPENGTEPSGNGSVDDIDGRRLYPGRSRPMSPTDTDFNGSLKPPRFPDIELGVPTDLESIPDVNVYQHKKTLAQGMMDLALFSANANQLRYVVESSEHPYYYSGVVLISFSLILQVAIGVGLIWNSRYNVKDDKEICIANKINNFTVIGIFLVTVVNVFISAFGVASTPTVVAASVVPSNP